MITRHLFVEMSGIIVKTTKMASRIYLKPKTELCSLCAKYPYLNPFDPNTSTNQQLTNKHCWEDECLDEGLDGDVFDNTTPSLWEE